MSRSVSELPFYCLQHLCRFGRARDMRHHSCEEVGAEGKLNRPWMSYNASFAIEPLGEEMIRQGTSVTAAKMKSESSCTMTNPCHIL